ncbi:MAG: enoyl-CoA hydratase [Gammaproteobacteria bacterium]|nr:enoyl-CoA hydratase [Gammaproteobacteria bacterium]
MSQYQNILYRAEGPIGTITLNRPESHNAQNIRLINEIDDALKEACGDDNVRVIVLEGAGRSFSSGHDLSIASADKDSLDTYEDAYYQRRKTPETLFDHEAEIYVNRCLAIRNAPKPTIAKVQGHCIAAGWMVASMCDLIIAADNARFANPVARMACVGAEIPVEFWDLGVRKAKELLFTGNKIEADEAKTLGMVNQVVPLDELDEFTTAMANKIAQVPPVTLKLLKQSMNRSLDAMGQANSFAEHFVLHQFGHQTQEFKEFMGGRSDSSVKAFVSRRDKATQA